MRGVASFTFVDPRKLRRNDNCMAYTSYLQKHTHSEKTKTTMKKPRTIKRTKRTPEVYLFTREKLS